MAAITEASRWFQWVQMEVAGYALWRLLLFFLVVLVALVAGRLVRYGMQRRAEREDIRRPWLGVLLRSLSRSAVLLAFAVGVRLSVSGEILVLPEGLNPLMDTLVRVLWAVAVGFTVYRLVDVVDFYFKKVAEGTVSRVDDMLAPLVGRSVRITVFFLVAIQVAHSVSDKPIASLIAGLGVGGLAVALAGQETIRNVFGSLVIVADKPFEIGERVVLDGHDGTVEQVGFRSTKIRTLDGHLVTVANAEVVAKTIRNVSRRPYIRRVLDLAITYDTPPEDVERALEILRTLLADHEGMQADFPPRVFFSGFNDWSLNIQAIYWYHPGVYWDYMKFSEWVNLEILRRFNAAGIAFAFPTQTIQVAVDRKGAAMAGGVGGDEGLAATPLERGAV